MICIMGKTASGKDTTVNELVKRGYHKIVTYTTRPMRDGEEQDKVYHFIDESAFTDMIERGELAEWKSYDTAFGRWYYGVAMKDLESAGERDLLIITPSGYKDIIERLGYRPLSVYIYCNNSEQRERLKNRGDNSDEIQRRIRQDNEDFKDTPNLVDKIVYNSGDGLEEAIAKIVEFAEGGYKAYVRSK